MADGPLDKLARLLARNEDTPRGPPSKLDKLADYLISDSIPAQMVQGAWSGLTYPGDVIAGKADPMDLDRAFATAGLASAGVIGRSAAGAFGERNALENIESRTANLYDPPVKSARPFEADYPSGAIADDAGRLQFDIEGRPLTARHVVGRTHVGGSDAGIPASAYDALAEEATGRRPQAVARGQIGGDAGRYVITRDRRSGDVVDRDIFVDKGLRPDQSERVVAHEMGHAINEMSGSIPAAGLNKELRTVYDELNNPQSHGRPYGPEQVPYAGDEIPRELMAEAVRAYMADPNYLKTVGPNTASRIREYVNSNPALNKTIQFNAGGVPIPLGSSREEEDRYRRAVLKGNAI